MSDLAGWVRHTAQSVLRRFGVELARYYDPSFFTAKRMEILQEQRIDLVLDVGANAGQYVDELRSKGFAGKIVSFEPTSEAFAALQDKAALDEDWSCDQLALSDEDGERSIFISANSWSSSLLSMTSQHIKSAPDSAYIASENVRTSRLDSVARRLFDRETRAHLKLDVQGYELSVLRGADRALEHVRALECELSVIPLYEGQALIGEVLEYLAGRAFSLAALEPGFSDRKSGQLLQLEGLFVRRSLRDAP